MDKHALHFLGNDAGMIQCLHAGPIPQNVINNYCYIQGTFTIPGHYKEMELIPKFPGDVHSWYPRVGNVISSAGVGPYNAGRKEDGSAITPVEVKAYYQWVPFMLFLQAIMFYVPHIVFKAVEGKKLKVCFRKVYTFITTILYECAIFRIVLFLNST